MSAALTTLWFAAPRLLPRAEKLPGRVVVLDVAFAATIYGSILIAIAAIGWHHYARREKSPPDSHPLPQSAA